MVDSPDNGGILRESFADAKRRIDFADLQAELGGLETGRMRRFLTEEQYQERKPGRLAERRSAETSRLLMLLANNAAYAALYQKTFETLRDAEKATERAMAKIADRIELTKRELEKTLERAARLPDGTRVFRDEHGQVWTEHGTPVGEADAAAIHWRGDEPSYEQFEADKAAHEAAANAAQELETYRIDVLGRIRDRLEDEENPATETEMEQYQREIDEKMPNMARSELNAPPHSGLSAQPTTSLTIPVLD